MKNKALIDDVLGRVVRQRPGFLSWFHRLPPAAQAELEQARSAFDPVKHQKKAYARTIIECCAERGWETSGIQGVVAWLNEKN